MAKIIKFDVSRTRPKVSGRKQAEGCEHKQVIAYTVFRTVHCAFCGTELDPFDVLVDMLKAHVPDNDDSEEKRLQKEVESRGEDKP